MKRRWISVLLITCMMLSMIPFSASATTETEEVYTAMKDYSAEIAAETTDWSINDAEDWRKAVEISEGEAGLTFEGQTLHLTADIDMESKPVNPLCYGINFKGTLDGHGYVFKNLKIEITSAAGCFVGLIGTVGSTCVVKNLGIENGAITLIYSGTVTTVGIGAIAGRMSTGGQILRCWNGADVTADVTGTQDDVSVGGIVGRGLRGSVIDSCYNIGSVSGALHAAGINDWMQTYTADYNSGVIRNSFNYGVLSAGYVGVGRLPKTTAANTFENTYSIGSKVAFSAFSEIESDTAAVLLAANTIETSNLKKVEYTSGKLAWKLNSNYVGDGEQVYYTLQDGKTVFGDASNQTVKINFVYAGKTVATAYTNADETVCLDELQNVYLEAEYTVGDEMSLTDGNMLTVQTIPATKTLTVEIVAGSFNESAEEIYSTDLWQYTIEEDCITLVQYIGTETDVYIPGTLEHEGTELPIIKLGDSLFEDNDTLNSVTLGVGILELGDRVFYGCDNIVCVLISEQLTTIGNEAFYGCTSMNSIILYDDVSVIGENAFAECPNLMIWCNKGYAGFNYAVARELPYELLSTEENPLIIEQDNITYYITNGRAIAIGCDASVVTVTIPATVNGYPVTNLKETFLGCSNLTSVTLPEGLQRIAANTFADCEKLTTVNIPNTVTRIDENAFSGCTSLKNLTLSKNLTKIEKYAFHGCSSLTSMVLPDSVTKIDAGVFSYCTNLTSITLSKNITKIPYNFFQYCKSLKTVTIPEKVTSIEDEAFYNCTSLISVEIPSSVTYIEDRVFMYCTSLTQASFIQNATIVEAESFFGCTSLKEVVIPDTVQTIDERAFYNCSALSKVTIPEGVTTINGAAFNGCTSLYIVSVPKTVTDIKANAFSEDTALIVDPDSAALNYAVENGLLYAIKGVDAEPTVVTQDQITYLVTDQEAIAVDCTATATSVTIPSTVNEKPVTKLQRTFKNCTSLTSVSLPETLTAIGTEAFYSCTSLTGITIPDGVTTIGSYAFYRCTKLASVQLPVNLETLNEGAFNNCSSIQSIVIPANTVTLGRSAFYSCIALSTVTFVGESKLETIGSSAFCYCTSLKSISIPSTVTSLGSSAFSYCKVLTSVTLPDGLTSIESGTFSDCTRLTSISLPDTITSIGNFAFESCTSLSSINIPTAVQSIGYTAFYNTAITAVTIPEGITTVKRHTFSGCNKLESVYLPDSLTTIEETAFAGCSSLEKIVLPQGITSIASDSFTSKTLLIVHENSYAHTFAEENQCLYTLYGDTEPTFCTVDSIRYCLIDGGYIAVGCTNSSIMSATIPATINGEPVIKTYGTFDGCSYLTTVSLPESLVEIGGHTFYSCSTLSSVNIPDSVKTIGKWAFFGCSALRSVDLPEKMDTIGESAFQQTKITSIAMPYELTTLGKQAFYHCENLQEITIPYGVKTIGASAFVYCRALQSVQLPETIESIGSDAFEQCDKLTSINFPESLTQIGSGAFGDCSSLTSAIIPNVTVVGGGAFADCSALAETDLRSVETLGGSAFSSCVGLTEVRLPNIKTVGLAAFAYCSNLTSVSFGDSLENLSYRVFDECYSLMTVRIPKKTEIANQNAFTSSMVLLVYENSPAHLALKSTSKYLFILRNDNNPETAYGTGITGTATYTDGTVAAGATAEIFYDDGTLKESVIVGADGNYSFTYAEVGRYTVRVTDTAGNSASTQVSVKRMNVFDVFLEGDTALTLKKGWSISGTTNENATLTVTDQEGKIIATTTTQNGCFTFSDIPNGTYVLKAEAESGSAVQEFTVFNGDISDLALTVVTQSVTLWGYVEVEDRELNHHRRNWVNVTVYNEEGVAVGQLKSDLDGKYTFENLPVGTYTLVAETAEMRPDKKHQYDRSHTLTGYAYIEATEAGTYEVETIVLYEENDSLATISGKVTAQGETQNCEVVLRNVFRHEVAKYTTGKNGKYSFQNIKDGLYFITATTQSEGMGLAVIVVRNGKVYGETDITVRKNDKILRQYESFNLDVPDCKSREDALQYKERIAEEKRLYDALSEKEKKQMPKDYVDRLNQYAEWITQVEYTAENGATVEGGGLVISGDELERSESITFNLSVEKVTPKAISSEGIVTQEDFINQSIQDTAGDRELQQYYEISMTKAVDGEEKTITSVQKDTESTGKFRITLPIPEEYRGYKHYSVIHVHHGKPVTLTDLDDDPNTVTFEVDQFSTFVLSASNTALTCETGAHTFEGETTLVPSTCTQAGTETGYCSVCEETVTMVLPLADHDYAEGICSVCGQPDLQSEHSYTDNLDQTWTYQVENAVSVTLTFSAETSVEENADYIYLYDANDNEIGCYTGKELASQSVTVRGDTCKIRLVSNDANTDYGFAVDAVDSLLLDMAGIVRLLRKIDKVDTTLPDEAADISGDGKVSVYDAVRFLQLLNTTPLA